MRAIAILLTVAAVALGATSAPAETQPPLPSGSIYAEQWVNAVWVVGKHDDYKMYFADITRMADHGGRPKPPHVAVIGAVGRGDCDIKRTWTGRTLVCIAIAGGRDIDTDDYSIDPAMSSAHLELQRKNYRQVVSWNQAKRPMAGQSTSMAGCSAYQEAGVARNSRAKGRVYGRRVTHKKAFWAYSFLTASANVFAWSDCPLRIRHVGDRVRVRAAIPLP